MYNFLLLDLDDTILDFQMSERVALSKTLGDFGLEPTQEVCTRYSVINRLHWEMLERKALTREEVLVGRFRVLFAEYGIDADPVQARLAYERNLSQGHYFLPGALEALELLKKKHRLFLVSNGTAVVQHSRLDSAGLKPYFEEIFISQEVGANKPAVEFFDRCFARIPGFVKERALIVGDSLTSDILGGIQAGIATCWVNPKGKSHPAHICPDMIIESLSRLPEKLQ